VLVLDVVVEVLFELFGGFAFRGGFVRGDAGVVDEDVEVAMFGFDFFDEATGCGLISGFVAHVI